MKCLNNLQIVVALFLWPLGSGAFESGSTDTDGAFNPTENTQVTLPANGVFNFTEVNIPAGVTVSFVKNPDNTPVTILASGDVIISGSINLNGKNAGGPNTNGAPGKGGPGGFDGGHGGLFRGSGQLQGGDGQGPGKGTGATNVFRAGGGGGSYGTLGQDGASNSGTQGKRGPVYGNVRLLPLIGGSGGGGGAGGSSGSTNLRGLGGGGGGGAILIAASGTVTITGSITARGGNGGPTNGSVGFPGSGSGGAIRIVATTIAGNGTITTARNRESIDGGDGRIRLETESLLRTSNTTPGYSFATPGLVLIPNLPALRISSVDGIPAPANPTGNRDIELPGITANPVPVQLETSNIPLGTTILVIASPERGTARSANSNGVAGTEANGTASADINLPNGNSLLTARTSFTVTAALGTEFSKYAKGEQVRKVEVSFNQDKGSETTFITVSGKEYTWPSNALAMNSLLN